MLHRRAILRGATAATASLASTLLPRRSLATEASDETLRKDLLVHLPLAGDARDVSGNERHATICGVAHWIDGRANSTADSNNSTDGPDGSSAAALQLGQDVAAGQNLTGRQGRDGWLELPADHAPVWGTSDFTLCLRVRPLLGTNTPLDLISQYDAATRQGIQWGLQTRAVTTSVANVGQLHFGIDRDLAPEWFDCGRPGNALLAFAMAEHANTLFVGTCEPAAEQSGRVYRWAEVGGWIDCGAPDRSNAVTCLAPFDGSLFAATGHYRVAGSALPESPNTERGGRMFRWSGGTNWDPCGELPDTEAVGGLVEYRGLLYASSLYKPAGFFRYEGGTAWTALPVPDGQRVEAMAVYDDYLWACSYDRGHVYRYDGRSWTDCGALGDNTQTYSFAVYEGRLHVGTWPSGRVYRFDDLDRWTDIGRLGEELEVMGMLVHNGRLLAGTLPSAEVYSYEGHQQWKRWRQLDTTPDVRYRRAWTMAEHQGRVYCSTLPSGHVHAFEFGHNVTWSGMKPSAWQHLAAVRRGARLELYVDGQRVATSRALAAAIDLDRPWPMRIGAGMNHGFRGELADVRLYGRSLSPEELAFLA
jgi:hypothetical protein